MEAALTQPAIRRLARRAGVKRINGLFYEEAQKALRSWMGPIVQRAAACAEHGRRMTITLTDILFALKGSGMYVAACSSLSFPAWEPWHQLC
jgi:histone H4